MCMLLKYSHLVVAIVHGNILNNNKYNIIQSAQMSTHFPQNMHLLVAQNKSKMSSLPEKPQIRHE